MLRPALRQLDVHDRHAAFVEDQYAVQSLTPAQPFFKARNTAQASNRVCRHVIHIMETPVQGVALARDDPSRLSAARLVARATRVAYCP